MERHFERSLQELVDDLKTMTDKVVASLDSAAKGLLERDASPCNTVFDIEKETDDMEVLINEKLLDFIALQQPVAVDLRFALSLQDIVVDLERIGDHCANIAQSAISLSMLRSSPDLLALPEMIPLARTMLQDSVLSFLNRDTALARRVLSMDDRMDEFNRNLARAVINSIKEDRELVETSLEIMRISKNLERIGDLSTNIAEDALFTAEGRIARHQPQV
jgi:phosphate transport system protein